MRGQFLMSLDDTDDLGFPVEGDPDAFARAFITVRRQHDLHSAAYTDRAQTQDIDGLGFSAEGDAIDFACAFRTLFGQPRLNGQPRDD